MATAGQRVERGGQCVLAAGGTRAAWVLVRGSALTEGVCVWCPQETEAALVSGCVRLRSAGRGAHRTLCPKR